MRQILLVSITAIIASLTAFAASGDEYFGKYPATLDGRLDPGPPVTFTLAHDFEFDDPNGLAWKVPVGSPPSDGASIPRLFWTIVGGPFDGPYIYAAIVHDYYCVMKTRTDFDTHRDFYYGMMAEGVSGPQAEAMYLAVQWFGPHWTLSSADQKSTAEMSPVIKTDDRHLVAAAQAKFQAMVRTLRTTNGAYIDIGAEGLVPTGSLEDIDRIARKYRELFLNPSALRENPALLGVIDISKPVGRFDDITPWRSLPDPKTVVPLEGSLKSSLEQGGARIIRSAQYFDALKPW